MGKPQKKEQENERGRKTESERAQEIWRVLQKE